MVGLHHAEMNGMKAVPHSVTVKGLFGLLQDLTTFLEKFI